MISIKNIFLLSSLFYMSNCKIDYVGMERKNIIFKDSVFNFMPLKTSEINIKKTFTNAMVSNINKHYSTFNTFFYSDIVQFKNEKEYDIELKKINEKSKAVYLSQDTNYFVIGSEYELTKRFDRTFIREKFSYYGTDKLIPFFGDFLNEEPYYSSSTMCGLKENFRINVIEYDNQSNSKVSLEDMPAWELLSPNIKHGYLKGIAYNPGENNIIYWVITW